MSKSNGSFALLLEDGTLQTDSFYLQGGMKQAKGLAAGDGFLITLLEDGTVQADNNAGSAGNVYSWKDITQLTAGAEHTLGLKSDGTVVAAGANDNGQCNVSDWTDIVYVEAGSCYSIGLKSDGSLLIAGKLPGEF